MVVLCFVCWLVVGGVVFRLLACCWWCCVSFVGLLMEVLCFVCWLVDGGVISLHHEETTVTKN